MSSYMEFSMEKEELRTLIQDAVTQAFDRVGLADDDARDDIRDLREFVRAYKAAKGTVFKGILLWFTMGVLGLLTFGAATKLSGMGGDQP